MFFLCKVNFKNKFNIQTLFLKNLGERETAQRSHEMLPLGNADCSLNANSIPIHLPHSLSFK